MRLKPSKEIFKGGPMSTFAYVGRFIGCTVFALLFAVAASGQQSWIWSRDDNSRPLNLSTDSISIVLLEARVPSGNNFLANDSQVGLLMDTKFTGSTADEPQANRNFPLMFEETADALSDPGHPHSKNLSDQEILVDYFPLTDGKTVYRSVSISVTLLRKQDPAVWTKVLSTFLSATKDVTLPSPLTVGVNYLSKFSTDILGQYLPNPNSQKRIDLGTFSFLVSKDPSQLNRVTNSGLHLRILEPTGTGPGWVDPNRWDSYCFYTKFSGSNWTVWVAEKDSTASDKDSDGCPASKYTQLMNDYVPILIEAEQTPGLLAKLQHTSEFTFNKDWQQLLYENGMGSGDQALKNFESRSEDMRKAALAQCASFGVKTSQCPAMRGNL
jgi:hypothetical protein